MVKVELPRASWDSVIYMLSEYSEIDWPRDPSPFVVSLIKEISDQVDAQEL